MHKYLVVGLGNLVRTDDAAGPLATRRARKELGDLREHVDFAENYSGGFDLLETMCGYRAVLLVDSMVTGAHAPGHFEVFLPQAPEARCQAGPLNSHGLNLLMLMEVGREFGLPVPERALIAGIEAADVETFSESLTDRVAAGLDRVVEGIHRILLDWLEEDGVELSFGPTREGDDDIVERNAIPPRGGIRRPSHGVALRATTGELDGFS